MVSSLHSNKQGNRISVMTAALLLGAICLAAVLTGCGNKEEIHLPGANTAEELGTEMKGYVKSTGEWSGDNLRAWDDEEPYLPAESETVKKEQAAESAENYIHIAERETGYSALEQFVIDNPEFGRSLMEAVPGTYYVYDNVFEAIDDMTGKDQILKADGIDYSLYEWQDICKLRLIAAWNTYIFAQQAFSELIGEEIKFRITYEMNGIVVAQQTFDNSSIPLSQEFLRSINFPDELKPIVAMSLQVKTEEPAKASDGQ